MINGMQYISNYIGEQEESDLISYIDSREWSNHLKRRTQHYGYKYDYTKKKIDQSMYVGLIPNWIESYSDKFIDLGFVKKKPDQVIVNEYLPGQGISRHVDCVPCFGNTVISLSLGSTCAMDFEQIKSSKKGTVILAPRSLLVLADEARYDWMHSIPARKEDVMNNQVLPRSRRISLTFRGVLL